MPKRITKEELNKIIEAEVQKRLSQIQKEKSTNQELDDPAEEEDDAEPMIDEVRDLTTKLSMERAVNRQLKDAINGLLKSAPTFVDSLKETLRYGVMGYRSIMEYDKALRKRQFPFMTLIIIIGVVVIAFAIFNNPQYAQSITLWFSNPVNEMIFFAFIFAIVFVFLLFMRKKGVIKP